MGATNVSNTKLTLGICLQFSLTSALANFETAVHNSFRKMFPGIVTKGCFFPLYPSNMENGTVDKTTDTPQRRRQREAKKSCNSRPPPPVPLQSIEDVWFTALKNNVADLTDTTKIFPDYVTERWVNGDRLLWNHLDIGGPHTNNSLKEWQGRLKRWNNTLTPKSSHS